MDTIAVELFCLGDLCSLAEPVVFGAKSRVQNLHLFIRRVHHTNHNYTTTSYLTLALGYPVLVAPRRSQKRSI